MRLGILSFGVDQAEASLTEALRARDIDLVPADAPVTNGAQAVREAQRIARADCDGVLVAIRAGASPASVTEAALFLAGTPLLVYDDSYNSAFFEAVGLLEEIGARFDRLHTRVMSADNTEERIIAWLRENAKPERHRGLEAARKLYGQRLSISPQSARFSFPDPALWMHQFGIIVSSAGEEADFTAPDGDAYGALTARLLELVSGSSSGTGTTVPVVAVEGGGEQEGDIAVTFARLSRRSGRFRCLLLRGVVRADGVSVVRWGASPAALLAAASSGFLHAIPGDHLGAMRAACESLDIEAMILSRP